jgi:NitT/TauT family transport system substrate-binding protein
MAYLRAPSTLAPTSRRAVLSWLGWGGLASGIELATELATGCSRKSAVDEKAATAGASSSATAAKPLRVGYLPITDATPLLVAHARGYFADEGLDVPRPTLLRSWPQVAEAFQARQVDLVHLLMPMTIWLRFGQGFPLKVVGWDHVDGSAVTAALRINRVDDLAGETVAVPFWYSIHNVILQQLLKKANLTPILRGDASRKARTVKLVVMAPPDMAPALANGSIAAFVVADPFNALAELNGVGRILRFTGDVWRRHACCVLTMHEDDLEKRPQWAQGALNAVAKAQRYTRTHRSEVAALLARDGKGYLPQPREVIERALGDHATTDHAVEGAIQHADWQSARIDFEPFPFPTYTEDLVTRLKDTLVEGDTTFLQKLDPKSVHASLVDDRFARAALTAAGGPAQFDIDSTLARIESFSP